MESLSGFVFTETDYDQVSGIHTIQVDYSARGVNPSFVERYIQQYTEEVVSHLGSVITFTVSRARVRQEFLDDIKASIDKIEVRQKRYYIGTGATDAVIIAGGVITVTLVEFLSYLNDRVAE